MLRSKKAKVSQQRLEELIDEATVDCRDEYEQHVGLRIVVTDNVQCPFSARVIGETVEVIKLEDDGKAVIATCRKGQAKKTYRIDLMSLEYTESLPKGYEWIEAYREWKQCNN